MIDHDLMIPTERRFDPDFRQLVANMGFWRGCLNTRKECLNKPQNDYERSAQLAAVQRIEAILERLEEGTPIDDIPEYRQWLAH